MLARVGSDVILACDVTAAVNELLAQANVDIPPEQMEMQRKVLAKALLKRRIQSKLIYQDAKRAIPKENLDKIKEHLSEQYDKVVVPERLKKMGVGSRLELEDKLVKLGTSLERERSVFIEEAMAQEWARGQVKTDVEITHDQMLRYYHEHRADFEHPARARWQQLMVRKSSYPTKAQAYAALAALGNQVVRGTPFEEVAKKRSEGIAAPAGGMRDWTTKGALVSEVLDKAIFGLPPGRMSRILEDDEAFHIVRVVEREEASVTPFLEAQVKIKEELTELNHKEQQQRYLARLEQQIPVWTAFDGKSPGDGVMR